MKYVFYVLMGILLQPVSLVLMTAAYGFGQWKTLVGNQKGKKRICGTFSPSPAIDAVLAVTVSPLCNNSHWAGHTAWLQGSSNPVSSLISLARGWAY